MAHTVKPPEARNLDVPLVVTTKLTKQYPGTLALDAVSIEVRRREVVGLVGENGAGKSTLLKVLAGAVKPDSGTLRVFGQIAQFRNVRDAARSGVGMVSQEQSVFPNLTVAENVALGSEDIVTPGLLYHWGKVRQWAQKWLTAVGSTLAPQRKVSELPFQDRQLVEFAKAMSVQQRGDDDGVLLLDEPTTVLDRDQIRALFALIEQLKNDTAIVFVSHRLEEVLEVSDRVYVMRDGRVVGERVAKNCSPDELFHLMVGDVATQTTATPVQRGDTQSSEDPILEIINVSGGDFHNVSFSTHAGEIVGIAGVQKSGKESLCRAVFGAEPITDGEVRVGGRQVSLTSPTRAVAAGIGYLPADRRSESAAANLNIRSNMTLAQLSKFSRWGLIRSGAEERMAEEWADRLRIKAPNLDVRMGTLSGGNQQKVLLARWLIEGDLRVMILDHPFRGLDIAAKREVHDLVRQLALDGIAVVLLADSLEELIELSHRIIVMKDGVITKEFTVEHDSPTPVEIVAEMV